MSSTEGRARRSSDSVALAAAVVDLAHRDPQEAANRARLLAEAAVPGSEGLVAARRAAGIAARERGDLEGSRAELTAAIALGDEIGATELTALCQLTLSTTLASLGDLRGAHLQLDRAERRLGGLDLVKVTSDRALLFWREGRIDDSVRCFERAVAGLVDHPDDLVACRVRGNYGVLLATAGKADVGVRELEISHGLAVRLGQRLLEARAAANLGFTEGQRGAIVAALRWFDRAEAVFATLADQESNLIVLEADRATILLQAGLYEEARDRTNAALISAHRGQNAADTADLELLHATALLAAGRPEEALVNIRRCRDLLSSQGRADAGWALKLDLVELECAVATDGDVLWADAVALAERFAGQRLPLEATTARLLAARLALGEGDLGAAEGQLTLVGRLDRLPTPGLRVQGWHTAALIRKALGHRGSARRALRAGLRALSMQQASVGSSELRTAAGLAGDELAELGVQMATEDRRPAEIFRWIETWRAHTFRLQTVASAPNEAVARLLAQLRTTEARRRLTTSAGEELALDRTRHRLEQAIRLRSWLDDGLAPTSRPANEDRRSLVLGSLDRAVLVEYYRIAGRLHALTVVDGRISNEPIDGAIVDREIAQIDAAMGRAARTDVSDASLAAAHRSMDASAATLERHLFRSLLAIDGTRPVVIVPCDRLHGLPWRSLPALRGRPVTVAASATHWALAHRSMLAPSGGDAAVLLVCGPDVPHAGRELDALGDVWPNATVLRDADASVAQVVAALRGADVAHIACHGRFRGDNPQFSSLHLADGPLRVDDLRGLQAMPETMVLSACDAGRSQARAGVELVGLSAALLAHGVRSLVAPVTPVSDEHAVEVMVELHTALRAGADVATAMADIGAAGGGRGRATAAASFLVMGAGWPSPVRGITTTDARS